MKSFTFKTKSSLETKKAGRILAQEIIKGSPRKEAFVLGLKGDLGGGKTTFLQGFAAGLGVKEKILSPTFLIFKKYAIKRSKFNAFFHFDCYRIESPKDLLILGFKEIVSSPGNIVAVEWAEKAEELIHDNKVSLKFEFINDKERKIDVKS